MHINLFIAFQIVRMQKADNRNRHPSLPNINNYNPLVNNHTNLTPINVVTANLTHTNMIQSNATNRNITSNNISDNNAFRNGFVEIDVIRHTLPTMQIAEKVHIAEEVQVKEMNKINKFLRRLKKNKKVNGEQKSNIQSDTISINNSTYESKIPSSLKDTISIQNLEIKDEISNAQDDSVHSNRASPKKQSSEASRFSFLKNTKDKQIKITDIPEVTDRNEFVLKWVKENGKTNDIDDSTETVWNESVCI